jgi:hypothetical protein
MFRLPIPFELDKEPKEVKSIIKIRDKNLVLENRLVIMPRDPTSIFAYYGFGEDTLRELKKSGRNEAYIGIHSEHTEDEKRIFFDINNEKSMNYYFTGLKPGTKYHAGIYLPRIQLFMRSNIVETPRNYISPDTSCEFMDINNPTLTLKVS